MDYVSSSINESPTVVFEAGDGLTEIQGKAVAIKDGKLALPEAGANAVGVAIFTNDAAPKAGDKITVQVKDIGQIVAGGAIAVGDEVAVDATGKAVKAEAGKFILGTAFSEATADGDVITIQITKSGYKATATA